MELNLTQRQEHILLAIVLDYIATAEPVGSRTISKKYDLGLSPATIRNEMSELEEQGLLTQLHSSSGRIPSDMGYRTFVDFLMERPLLSDNEISRIKSIQTNTSKLDFVLEQSARVLSALLNTVAIIQFPESNQDFVKHFQLLPINDSSFVIVLVTSTGKVNDYRVNLEHPVNEDFFIYLTNYFNEQLVGTPVSQLHRKLLSLISGNIEQDNVLKTIYNSIKNSLNYEKSKFCVTGTSKIIQEPEFNENEKAHSIINYFEGDDNFKNLSEVFFELKTKSSRDDPVILIGKEINISPLQNCSLIIGTYNIGENSSGSIGILGPTRMHYGKSIVALEEMIKNLSYLLARLYGINTNDNY